MAEHWEEEQHQLKEEERKEAPQRLDVMQQVPELAVNERMSQDKRVKNPKEKKKVTGWMVY